MRTQVGVGVAAVILNEDGLLLMIKRKGKHGAGTWALPGGWMDHGEVPIYAAMREVKEETGLKVVSGKLLGMSNNIHNADVHDCCIYVQCVVHDSMSSYAAEPKEPDKIEAVEWVTQTQAWQREVFSPTARLFSGDLLWSNEHRDAFMQKWRK